MIRYTLNRKAFDMKRAERGLTIEAMEKRFSNVKRWLYGDTNPTIQETKRLADFFGCEIRDLFDIEVS